MPDTKMTQDQEDIRKAIIREFGSYVNGTEQRRYDRLLAEFDHLVNYYMRSETFTVVEGGQPVEYRVSYAMVKGHAGPGWYYHTTDYPDEGSVGAFLTKEAAIADARQEAFPPKTGS
jgi:hypothetical protein